MIWLIATIILLVLLLSVSFFYIVKFGTIVINVQDVIEESLDLLDQRYESIYKVLQTPLFYDSPEIRQVLHDIEATRHTIVDIATALTSVEAFDIKNNVDDEG
ncbi:hypothetical protein CL614_09545 [archaeon]|nr:hypothetical protein [archaeon]